MPPLRLLFFQAGNAGPYRLFNHVTDRPETLMPAAALSFESQDQAYNYLLSVSPDLAYATVTLRADRGGYGSGSDSQLSSLDSMEVLREILMSPYRHVDTVYVDAAEHARGLVGSEYLFNYVPNAGTANVVRGPNGATFVHYSIEIEPQYVTLAKDGDSYYTTLELAEEVTTLDGHPIFQATKTRYVKLTENEFRKVHTRPLAYRSMFPLVEGEFTFRVVLKNLARSEYTIFETPIRVTEAGDDPVLGEPILLYDVSAIADTESTEDDYRPYQIGSIHLDPNARRLYAIGEPVAVYVPIENASADELISLQIESNDPTVPDGVAEKETSATRTRRFGDYEGARVLESLSTEGLSGGRYRLLVGLTKGKGEDAERRSVDFSITPLTKVLRPWIVSDRIHASGDGAVLLSLAKQYAALGDLAKAREMSARSLAENPSLTSARVFLAHAALDSGEPEDAIALLEPALEANKDHYELLVILGDAYMGVSNYERAVQLFEAAMGLRGPNTKSLNALAECHMKLGNVEKARDLLERSLALDPKQENVELLLQRMRTSTRP